MKKVYVVIGYWKRFDVLDYIDNRAHGEDIHAVFDSEEKAVEFIKNNYSMDPDEGGVITPWMNYVYQFDEKIIRQIRYEPHELK